MEPNITAPPTDPTKKEAIKRLLEVSRALWHFRRLSAAAAHKVLATSAHLPSAQAERVSKVTHEEADRLFAERSPAFADTLVPMYERHFTLEEIEEMAAFYASPLGVKLQERMPAVLDETHQAIEDLVRSLLPEIHERTRMRLLNESSKPCGTALSPR